MRIVVWGAGGFGREVRWLIEDIARTGREITFAGYVVSDLDALGERDSVHEVVGDIDWLVANKDVDAVAIGIGNAKLRRQLGNELRDRAPRLAWPALIHPSVQYDERTCLIEEGVLLCSGVIATVNVTFKRFSMANLSCTIGHEATIGEGSVLLPTVNISGGVVLGQDVLVGTGAQVLEYRAVGDGAQVGAGAVVTKDVGSGETVVGVPARPLRKRGS